MKEKKRGEFDYHIYRGNDTIPSLINELIEKASKASENAYAPYSNLNIGAAALLSSGKILVGSNFENASYPLCLCAERVVLAHAHSKFPGEQIEMLAVTANFKGHELEPPIMPCGACRQVLSEVELKQDKQITLLVPGQKGEVYEFSSVRTILPFGFKGDFLRS